MKTERRHELETNDLAAWITTFLEKYRSHGKLVVGLIGLAMVAWLAMSYVERSSERANAGAWSSYFQALESFGSSEAQFEAVASAYPDSPAGKWAKLTAADRLMRDATRLSFSDRDEAKVKLKSAKEHLDEIENVSDELLRPRAMIYKGETLESLGSLGGQESLAQAEDAYQRVAQGFADTVLGNTAIEQLDRLQRYKQDGWYSWFASQEPTADPLSTPGLFDDIGNVPDEPNVAVPGVGSLIRPDGADSTDPVDLNVPENPNENESIVPTDDSDLDLDAADDESPADVNATDSTEGEFELNVDDPAANDGSGSDGDASTNDEKSE